MSALDPQYVNGRHASSTVFILNRSEENVFVTYNQQHTNTLDVSCSYQSYIFKDGNTTSLMQTTTTMNQVKIFTRIASIRESTFCSSKTDGMGRMRTLMGTSCTSSMCAAWIVSVSERHFEDKLLSLSLLSADIVLLEINDKKMAFRTAVVTEVLKYCVVPTVPCLKYQYERFRCSPSL